jgi:hypothetical protein
MKKPHSPFSRDEIDVNLDAIKQKLSDQLDRVEELGEDRQRIEFFDALRKLILEKDSEGDEIAVSVLCWAYERLAEEN